MGLLILVQCKTWLVKDSPNGVVTSFNMTTGTRRTSTSLRLKNFPTLPALLIIKFACKYFLDKLCVTKPPQIPMGHVTLVAIYWTTILAPYRLLQPSTNPRSLTHLGLHGDARIRQRTRSSSVQVMVRRLLRVKPVSQSNWLIMSAVISTCYCQTWFKHNNIISGNALENMVCKMSFRVTWPIALRIVEYF